MSVLEISFTGILALWALGSALFVFRLPGVHGVLKRAGKGVFFMHWSLFSPSDESLRAGTMELSYRERRADGTTTPWTVAALGHCWSWRAAFWLPERFLATAIQTHGRDVRTLVKREIPSMAAARARARMMAEFVERCQPAGPGTIREYRLVRRFASDGAAEELLELTAEDHGRAG
jgi:hypothetical protein